MLINKAMLVFTRVLCFWLLAFFSSYAVAISNSNFEADDSIEFFLVADNSDKYAYDADENLFTGCDFEYALGNNANRAYFSFIDFSNASKGGLGTLRASYLQQVDDLAGAASSIRAAGVNADDALRILAPLRNELKLEVRRQGPWWAARAADIRNIFKYGNRAGPSADDLVRQYGSAENALEALGRTSSAVNRATGAGK